MRKVRVSKKTETKSDIFPWGIFNNLRSIFFCQKILKYFNDFKMKTSQLHDQNKCKKGN